MLYVTPNAAARDLLSRLIEQAEPREGEELAFEAMLPIRITKADLDRVSSGNGDMLRIGFWVSGAGADPVAMPDPDVRRDPWPYL